MDPHALDLQLRDPAFGLRLNFYPPVTDSDLATGAGRMRVNSRIRTQETHTPTQPQPAFHWRSESAGYEPTGFGRQHTDARLLPPDLLSLPCLRANSASRAGESDCHLVSPQPPHVKAASCRRLGHEDMDLFTLLPRPSHHGLQVRNPVSGKWIRLQPPPNSIILNVGDYLQRISNDVLPSTTHRVATPSAADPSRHTARTSTPIAIYLRESDMLSVLPGLGEPKYTDISALDFHVGVMSKYYGEGYRQTGSD